MFRRHGFFRFLLMGFLFIGLFSAIRGASYRSAWMDGFAAGRQTAVTSAEDAPANEDALPAVQAPYYRGPHWGMGRHMGSLFFWVVGGFFRLIFFLFILALIFKLLRFARHHHWHHHNKEWKHFHHGHTPPWYDDSGEEPIIKA